LLAAAWKLLLSISGVPSVPKYVLGLVGLLDGGVGHMAIVTPRNDTSPKETLQTEPSPLRTYGSTKNR
jgi:hypothetical protein